VVGDKFAFSNTVLGNCSYSITPACSGRGCHSVTTYYYHTCTWDTYGNLMSVVTGAPPPQTCSGTSTTNPYELICATSGTSSTGCDTRGFGFVETPAPHYSWQTPNGAYAVIPDAPYAVAATLVSDGDLALTIGTPAVTTHVNGTTRPPPGLPRSLAIAARIHSLPGTRARSRSLTTRPRLPARPRRTATPIPVSTWLCLRVQWWQFRISRRIIQSPECGSATIDGAPGG
jgi:hypothetical protein